MRFKGCPRLHASNGVLHAAVVSALSPGSPKVPERGGPPHSLTTVYAVSASGTSGSRLVFRSPGPPLGPRKPSC